MFSSRLLTVDEMADILRVSSAGLYRLLREGKIKGAFRLNGSGNWRIEHRKLLQWITDQERRSLSA